MRPLALALQLLTRLPVPTLTAPPQPWELGQAVLFFPFVGLLIGALLTGLHTALWWADPGVLAALMLAVWVLLTGGLHLDGLADTADAWIGGQGDRERTLAIMKDSHSGPMAISAIVLVL
ncbi:MAG: adenosylcobinamide-GDP ribazoletransferase, partial [Candidatus Competibacteraceae bacterium]|nr:adenosylcobinamide-GDP ribazoletransferase [Candidatus Competibacteraceae bacterium]